LQLFSLSPRLDPGSTYIAYTTLFRSTPGNTGGNPLGGDLQAIALHPVALLQSVEQGAVTTTQVEHPAVGANPLLENFQVDPEHQDRKSTRLNSSHVKISYAVFSLKKR